MAGPRWIRSLARFALQLLLLAVLVGAALRLTGRFVTIERNGGDQSQTSAVDLTPLPAQPSLPLVEAERVRNVVLIVADGMGFSHVVIGRSELRRLNEKLFFERFPVTGWQTTHALASVYTDSAASASSLATGHKVPYLGISVDGDGLALRTVAEAALDRGMAVGVVTDSYLWDATPAAFLAHAATRRERDGIIEQMIASGAALLVGESDEGLFERHSSIGDLPVLLELARQAGFDVVRSAAELADRSPASPAPVFALFDEGTVADPDTAPDLLELARFAIDKLSRDDGGYLLLVESEEIDSGAHRRELFRIVRGLRSIDEVARLAVDRALADRSTLVLVTADHETGGLDVLHGDAEHTLGIRWSTTSHTAEPVPIYAFGAGADRFAGVKDNTEIARILSELLDLGMFE
jgi:alkaline phosphatase